MFLFDQACSAENQGKAAAASWLMLLHIDPIWLFYVYTYKVKYIFNTQK